MMQSRTRRSLAALDLEEKILNSAALFALVSVFLPWFSGEWLGEDFVSYNGFRFFTAFLGTAIFLLHAALLALTVVPLSGGPALVKKRHRETARLILAAQATILALAALSVLTIVTYDYTRMEIRFGIYCTFIGSLITTFYAFWRMQEQRRMESQEVFHHPEDREPHAERFEPAVPAPPPPPPPPPLKPEDHRIRP